MIVVQYIFIILYTWQTPELIYSEAIVERPSPKIDSLKCSINGQPCLKNKRNSPLIGYSENYDNTPSYYEDEENTKYDEINYVNNEIVYEEAPIADNYPNDYQQDFLVKSAASKVKRSLELVEEQPPEGTYHAPANENEGPTAHTTPYMPSNPPTTSMPPSPDVPHNTHPGVSRTPTTMPSVPSIQQPPTMSSTEPQYVNTKAATEVTTQSPEVELLETTTEDYGGDDEPNCDYDPITWIFKCGFNLITSLLGFSDTCCKPIF